jgi:hypothetical protein
MSDATGQPVGPLLALCIGSQIEHDPDAQLGKRFGASVGAQLRGTIGNAAPYAAAVPQVVAPQVA